jgi:hypothetical protein
MPRVDHRLFAAAFLALSLSAASPAARTDTSKGEYGPDPASVQRHGKGYRYPQAGWIVVHIEGTPYDRGTQHGRLLAPEIADYLAFLAAKRDKENPAAAWGQVRTLTNALFLRRYDPEFLEEMKGIADGAAAAGAKFSGRPLDLLDIVAVNSDIEIEFLDAALEANATGLEGKVFKEPSEPRPKAPHAEHCSAFAATGPATADGKIVFGHITMFGLAFARHFNVWLDIKPTNGHRVLMQTYAGGIQSGMDYYMNDAGLLVAETTIGQTKFNDQGAPLASRIRKTLQYADSIDSAIAILSRSNNGLYTNEWLLGDIKTNEIAMFELGTHKSKLWRSAKDEWFGGTKGFYWGCNNAKDLDVRLETIASMNGRPEATVWAPSDRDSTWVKLFHAASGKIDTSFGFHAFTTPPLSAFSSLDAKFTTSAMAKDLKTHALFGPPLGRTWDPTDADRTRFPATRPLVSNDWTILTAEPPAAAESSAKPAIDLAGHTTFETAANPEGERPPAWHGTILAESDADTWLATAFANYERIFAKELAYKSASKDGKLTELAKERLELARYRLATRRWLATVQIGHDVALDKTASSLTERAWYEIAVAKGVEVLRSLRTEMGDDAFAAFMDKFGREHAGSRVSTQTFIAAAEKSLAKPIGSATRALLTAESQPSRASWAIDTFEAEPEKALIIHGTLKDAAANREAASRLQRLIARRWPNITIPIKADKDVDASDLRSHHLLLVGGPQSHSLLPKFSSGLPIKLGSGSFIANGETYAHASSAMIAAGPNPENPRFEVVLFSGLGAESTWNCVESLPRRSDEAANVLVLAVGSKPRPLVVHEAGK